MQTLAIAVLAALVLCVWNMLSALGSSNKAEELRNLARAYHSWGNHPQAHKMDFKAHKHDSDALHGARWSAIMGIAAMVGILAMIVTAFL